MKTIKKVVMPAVLSVSVLGLAACGNSNGNALITSKAGDVTTQDIIDSLGKEQVAQTSFELLISDILKDKYSKEVDEKKTQKDIDKEIEKYGGEKQFESILKQQQPGMTVDQYKTAKINNEYQKKLMNDTVKVSDDDVKKYTKKASHILIKVKSDSDKEGLSDKDAKAKAEEILKEVKANPNNFGKIAKKESEDKGSQEQDGSLGYVLKGQTVEPFEKALFKLKENEISDIVKTDFGYHIIKADKQDDFDKEKGKIKDKIRQTKIQDNPDELINAYKKLLDEYDVKYKDKDVKKIIEEQYLKKN